jgi:hypothetical protein
MPRTSLTRHFRCHITVCYTQLITPTSVDELPVVGGRCTGGAHRRKVKQGCREDRSDVWILASKVVRFGGRVQRLSEPEKIIMVTMAALCYLIIAQGSDRRCGRLLLTNLRGRNAGIVPVDGCLGHATFISIVGNDQYFDTGEVPP